MADTTPDASAPKRRRRPPRAVTVERTELVTPRLTRITFGGEGLAGFDTPRPGAHMKLFFPPAGMEWPPKDPEADGPRPPSRTYTPRRFDAARNELEVEFVHHGDGLAANWAQSAKVGDPLSLAGPGGGYDIADDAERVVLVADETSMPAAGMVLESVPAGCEAIVLCEVIDGGDERELSPVVSAETRWLHRAPTNARQGSLLERAVIDLGDLGPNTYFWIACEAATMRRIKKRLMTEGGYAASNLHTRGYWKLGETNYPDHDYGED